MKRKLVSLFTALSLCAALATPALAADMTVEEGLRPITLNSEDSGGNEFTPSPRPQELWLGDYDSAAGVLTLETLSSCLPTPAGLTFTVSNEGGAQECFLVVRAVEYSPMSVAEAGEYAEDERSDSLSAVTGDTVYVGFPYGGGDYLCSGGMWKSGLEGAAEEAVRVQTGDSVSFQLPGTVQEGDLCLLYVEAYYTQPDGTSQSFWARYDILLDSSAGSEPATAFTDVKADAYYADAVEWAVDKGITSGTSATTFSPDTTCTTAQILTFLWRANGSPAASGGNPFSDVSADAYYYQAALWASEKGLISGSVFNGDTPCTRAATVTYLWKLAGQPSVGASGFTDVPAGSDYAQAVAWAVEEGITSGTSATAFSPDTTCTRAQIMTFLYRDMAQ